MQDELAELVSKYSNHQEYVVQPTAIPSVFCVHSARKTDPVHSLYSPSFCMIVQGEKVATINGKTYKYTPSNYLVTSVDVPVAGQVTLASPKAPYLCFVLTLDAKVIYDIVKDAPPVEAKTGSGVYLEKRNPDLTDAVLRLMRCLKTKADTEVLAPMIVREITYRLLSSKYGDVVRQLGIAGSQTQRIAKVVEMIRRDYARPLSNDELARTANMSPSTFHHHFKLVTTMSPLQYQKHIRLHEARRLLTAEVSDAATAAFKVGYESPSQFSREYARLFGLPPISDIKRLRQIG